MAMQLGDRGESFFFFFFFFFFCRHTLIPPLGYKIAGIAGSCGAWVDGFTLIISH